MLEILTEFMAKRCDNCPLCNYARENPDGIIGKVMELHGKLCPFWRSWERTYGEQQRAAETHSE